MSAATSQPEKVIQLIKAELPGLRVVAAIDVASGKCLASYCRPRAPAAEWVAEHHATTVRQQQLALQAWPGRPEQLTDMLIPMRRHLHLLRVARKGEWFVYLAVKADELSLALAREVLRMAMKRAGC
ncbi:hypothetical protein FY528_06355 [Hymenobacter lutimineralis]|uniref:Roadblock/LC7 domain-containing protein n=1 Tax=Hymenobacter lutimineralis TaxID=2606448 RepID=A0A5D6V8X6_9BACT|nr:hypothetical protein [Hymenobacter lutimineralis]TYZ11966.1 hypothetical protein FY528_06355 [Hymenobacter lutimineralis]